MLLAVLLNLVALATARHLSPPAIRSTQQRTVELIGPVLSCRGGKAPKVEQLGVFDGKWTLDAKQSESMTPFLIAVGAPRIIAKLVGKKGKPVTLRVDGASVAIQVEGKDREEYRVGEDAPMETPRGTVSATLVLGDEDADGDGKDGKVEASFTIVKSGPVAGEVTTEVRQLLEEPDADGKRVMRCIFTHTSPKTGVKTRVVRYYTRA